ncbi:hypothetical protein Y017_13085 [Alcanivorax sp. 97CO-5]|uniref:DUF6957 family protein n=1 Tax=unclassified Alcanivorax TaxID=2638842 RepID=UPI0003E7ED7D|nr:MULTISPECIES: hypothetical protein [unclassified Alcanivorax]EUC69900.1 hypothetical protein Y017_13085 [Alcanivorax sp. 97CO-5]PKG01680.1 hypothetical protein Y019_07955 [Alcanivorax sp. 97CO-6]
MLPFEPIFDIEEFKAEFALTGPAEKILFSKYEGQEVESVISDVRSVSSKPACLIAAWVIIDLELGEKQLSQLATDGVNHGGQPYVLYSRFLIADHRERWPLGAHVFSTPVARNLGGGLFETAHTAYVLYGQGYRLGMDVNSAARIKDTV